MEIKQAIMVLALASCAIALGNMPPWRIRLQHDIKEYERELSGHTSSTDPEPKGEFFSFTDAPRRAECRYFDADINNGYACGHASPVGEFFRNAEGTACRFRRFEKTLGYYCELETKLTELGALPASMPQLKCDEYWEAQCWPSGVAYNGRGWRGDEDDDFEEEIFDEVGRHEDKDESEKVFYSQQDVFAAD